MFILFITVMIMTTPCYTFIVNETGQRMRGNYPILFGFSLDLLPIESGATCYYNFRTCISSNITPRKPKNNPCAFCPRRSHQNRIASQSTSNTRKNDLICKAENRILHYPLRLHRMAWGSQQQHNYRWPCLQISDKSHSRILCRTIRGINHPHQVIHVLQTHVYIARMIITGMIIDMSFAWVTMQKG